MNDKKRSRFNVSQFKVEIASILIIKIIALFLLWWAFFSHPVEKASRQKAVTQVILNP